MSGSKPFIGITLGDYNGIGPEVILKALGSQRILKWCTPVIYGSQQVIQFYRKQLELQEWSVRTIAKIEDATEGHTSLISCWDDTNTVVEPGKVTPEAGKAAFACLDRAAQDLDKGLLAALVTAPINKHNIQSADFKFPGHTEYLTERFEAKNSLMMMVSEGFRMGVATGHLPLQEVSKALTKELIKNKIDVFLQSLKEDFAFEKPKLAVLGLNPHAGEAGLLGQEELEVIQPVIEEYRKKGFWYSAPTRRMDSSVRHNSRSLTAFWACTMTKA